MNPKNFKHSTPLQIRFSDIDKLNHVNNAVYLNYFETGRVYYFDTVLGKRHDWNKEGLVVVRNEINYLLPLHLHDRIECLTRCIRIGNKSITVENLILRNKNGKKELVAGGIGVLVCMDYSCGESIPVPDNWKKKILRYEKVKPEVAV